MWAKPKAFSKTLQNHLQNGTKAERVSSKALRRRSSLVLARTLLGSRAGRGLARAQRARDARVEFFPNPPPGCQSGDERSIQVRAGAEAAAASEAIIIVVVKILRADFHILDGIPCL